MVQADTGNVIPFPSQARVGKRAVSAPAVLELARRYGVTVEARGDRLDLRAPEKPPDEVLEALRQHARELLRYLSQRCEPEQSAADASNMIPFPVRIRELGWYGPERGTPWDPRRVAHYFIAAGVRRRTLCGTTRCRTTYYPVADLSPRVYECRRCMAALVAWHGPAPGDNAA